MNKKSRPIAFGNGEGGTCHSNQGRELLLSRSGVTLTDVHQARGKTGIGLVLLEKEAEDSKKQLKIG